MQYLKKIKGPKMKQKKKNNKIGIKLVILTKRKVRRLKLTKRTKTNQWLK
jgi:hypothetical protein